MIESSGFNMLVRVSSTIVDCICSVLVSETLLSLTESSAGFSNFSVTAAVVCGVVSADDSACDSSDGDFPEAQPVRESTRAIISIIAFFFIPSVSPSK